MLLSDFKLNIFKLFLLICSCCYHAEFYQNVCSGRGKMMVFGHEFSLVLCSFSHAWGVCTVLKPSVNIEGNYYSLSTLQPKCLKYLVCRADLFNLYLMSSPRETHLHNACSAVCLTGEQLIYTPPLLSNPADSTGPKLAFWGSWY